MLRRLLVLSMLLATLAVVPGCIVAPGYYGHYGYDDGYGYSYYDPYYPYLYTPYVYSPFFFGGVVHFDARSGGHRFHGHR